MNEAIFVCVCACVWIAHECQVLSSLQCHRHVCVFVYVRMRVCVCLCVRKCVLQRKLRSFFMCTITNIYTYRPNSVALCACKCVHVRVSGCMCVEVRAFACQWVHARAQPCPSMHVFAMYSRTHA